MTSFARVLVAVVAVPLAAAAGYFVATIVAGADEPLPPVGPGEVLLTPRAQPIADLHGASATRGIVLSEAGRPIGGALVRASAGFAIAETKTNDLGRFVLDGLPKEPVSLVVIAEGFRPEWVSPRPPDGPEATIRLHGVERISSPATSRAAPSGSLVVELTLDGDRASIPPLDVAAIPLPPRAAPMLPRQAPVESLAQPIVRLADLPAGRYRLVAIPRSSPVDARLAFAEAEVEVKAATESRATLTYRRATVRGFVSSGGAPVEGAFVRALRRSTVESGAREMELQRAVTAADGRFALDSLPHGASTLEVLVAGHQPWSRTVQVPQETESLTVELEKSR